MEGFIAAIKRRRPKRRAEAPRPAARPGSDSGDEEDIATTRWRRVPQTRPGDALASGATVARYVMLQRLGAGGMGVVHAAYDPELDRKVALKLMRPGVASRSGRTRLLREAQVLAKLSHPNIVAIHDVGTVGGQVWLAMELVQGQTLGEWLRTRRSWREVVRVMRRAGEGLAAAHAADLLHRDFKPENVMVGDDGRVRVMDFGLARSRPDTAPHRYAEPQAVPVVDTLAMEITTRGTILGTPSYMAPEQLDGGSVTTAADQYSFCVTLWEALFRSRPPTSATRRRATSRLGARWRALTAHRGVPGWLRRACVRGLSPDPSQRWPSMDALLDVLAHGQARARVRQVAAAAGVLALLGVGAQACQGGRHESMTQTTVATPR